MPAKRPKGESTKSGGYMKPDSAESKKGRFWEPKKGIGSGEVKPKPAKPKKGK